MKDTADSPQPGPKQRAHVFGYLDETGLLHTPPTDKFFGLGLLIVQNPRYIHRAIIRLKNQQQFYNEFKFTSVDRMNLPIYKRFIDIVFDTVNLRFNAIIVDKAKITVNKNYTEKYNKYAGYLAARSIDQTNSDTSEYITILADDVSTNDIDDKFERIIRDQIKKKVRRNALFGICRLESHAVTELQICDVLIGAVAYACKMSEGIVRSKTAKAQLVKYIQGKMNTFSIALNLSLRLRNGIIFNIEKR
jgi:hypothetical protein